MYNLARRNVQTAAAAAVVAVAAAQHRAAGARGQAGAAPTLR